MSKSLGGSHFIQMKWSHYEDGKGHKRGKVKCVKRGHLSNYFQENMISCYFTTQKFTLETVILYYLSLDCYYHDASRKMLIKILRLV